MASTPACIAPRRATPARMLSPDHRRHRAEKVFSASARCVAARTAATQSAPKTVPLVHLQLISLLFPHRTAQGLDTSAGIWSNRRVRHSFLRPPSYYLVVSA